MENTQIETPRLILRRFEEQDLDAVYLLFSDAEVNTFLPWFPVKDRDEAREFLQARLRGKYCYAICRRQDGLPIGYLHTDEADSHDFGYALRKEYWHRQRGGRRPDRAAESGRPALHHRHPRPEQSPQRSRHAAAGDAVLLLLQRTVAAQRFPGGVPYVPVEL